MNGLVWRPFSSRCLGIVSVPIFFKFLKLSNSLSNYPHIAILTSNYSDSNGNSAEILSISSILQWNEMTDLCCARCSLDKFQNTTRYLRLNLGNEQIKNIYRCEMGRRLKFLLTSWSRFKFKTNSSISRSNMYPKYMLRITNDYSFAACFVCANKVAFLNLLKSTPMRWSKKKDRKLLTDCTPHDQPDQINRVEHDPMMVSLLLRDAF